MLNKRNDLLNGPVLSGLLLFAFPLFLSFLFQHLYSTVDTVIVGNHLGEMSLAAIGASTPVFQLLIGFCFGFSGGFGIVISRGFGSGDDDLLKKSVAGSIIIGAVMIGIVMLISVFFLKPFLVVLKTPEEILELTYDYIFIVTIFAGVAFIYNLTSVILRSIGNSIVPLLFLVLSSVLNIGLDLLFVIAFGWGIKGAAIATVLSQGVSAILSLIFIWYKEAEVIPERKHFLVGRSIYKELIGQGLSMAMMMSLVYIGTIILQYSINQMGYLVIAAHTTGRRVLTLLMMPITSIALSISTFVSQNKGADKGERILQAINYSNLLGILWSICIAVVVSIFSEDMIQIVSGSEEPVVVTNGSKLLLYNVPFFAVLSMLSVTRYSLQGLGEKIKPLISSVTELVMKLAFVVYIIPRIGYTGVIISEPIIWIVMTIQLVISFYRNPYIISVRQSSDHIE